LKRLSGGFIFVWYCTSKNHLL